MKYRINNFDFKLFAFVKKDLIRSATLIAGNDSPPSFIRIYLGIFSPRFTPVLFCRLAYFFYKIRLGLFAKIISLMNFIFFGIEIGVQCQIGPGLFLPHTQGTVIGAWKIGANATIFQGVTLGAKKMNFNYSESERPSIGDNVLIGAGAKVLGGVIIEDEVEISANSLVVTDVARGKVVGGIPAKVLN